MSPSRHPFDEALTRETLPADPLDEALTRETPPADPRLAALRAAAKRQATAGLARTEAERARREAGALRLLWARFWRPYEALSARDRKRAAFLAREGSLVRLLNDPRHGPPLREAYQEVGGWLGWVGVLRALTGPTGQTAVPVPQGVFESLMLFLCWKFVLARCDPGEHWYARQARGRRTDACAVHGRPRVSRRYWERRGQRRAAFRRAHPQAWRWLDELSRRAKALSEQKRRRDYSEAWYRQQVREAAARCAAGLTEARDGTPKEWVGFFGARSTLLGRYLAEALGLPGRR
ncbi:MAG: hypothetical protein QN131_06075 [Armatimonadota bacterium]|nr:hypothetical protein [Armatimonadota bacterium]